MHPVTFVASEGWTDVYWCAQRNENCCSLQSCIRKCWVVRPDFATIWWKLCLLHFYRNNLFFGGGADCCWNWWTSWSLFPLRICLVSIFVNSSPFLQLPVTDVIISQSKQPVDVHLREGGAIISAGWVWAAEWEQNTAQSVCKFDRFHWTKNITSTRVMDPCIIKHGFFYNVSVWRACGHLRSRLLLPIWQTIKKHVTSNGSPLKDNTCWWSPHANACGNSPITGSHELRWDTFTIWIHPFLIKKKSMLLILNGQLHHRNAPVCEWHHHCVTILKEDTWELWYNLQRK